MKKLKGHYVPISLEGLNKKIDLEIRRLVREKEENIVRHIRTKITLNGISTLVFKNKAGRNVTLLYRHDESGTLRFAREKQFAQKS
jgi:hypothetical protein